MIPFYIQVLIKFFFEYQKLTEKYNFSSFKPLTYHSLIRNHENYPVLAFGILKMLTGFPCKIYQVTQNNS